MLVTFFKGTFFSCFCRWLSMHGHGQQYFIQRTQFLQRYVKGPGLEVIKLEFILRLKIKRSEWLLADKRPQAANHCALF